MIYTTVFTDVSSAAGRLENINGNLIDDARIFEVLKYVTGTFQFVLASGSWSSAVFTLERSNDGENFVALSSAVTVSAAGMTNTIDISGIAYLRVRTSTVNGATLTVKIIGCFKGD